MTREVVDTDSGGEWPTYGDRRRPRSGPRGQRRIGWQPVDVHPRGESFNEHRDAGARPSSRGQRGRRVRAAAPDGGQPAGGDDGEPPDTLEDAEIPPPSRQGLPRERAVITTPNQRQRELLLAFGAGAVIGALFVAAREE